MSKPYEPREGSLADKVIGLLEINGGDMSTGEISREFDIPHASVNSGLLRAVDHGLLFTYLKGHHKHYTLVPPANRDNQPLARAAAEPTPSRAELDTFNAAIWADGELSLHGVTPNDDGITVLTADQAAQVLRLLSGRMYA